MNRRHFVRYSLGALVLLGGGIGVSYWRMPRAEAIRSSYLPPQASFLSAPEQEIVYLASLAPSSHNTQPWRVAVGEPGQWLISADPSCQLPAVDPENKETLLSMGAFIENFVLAAKAYGYGAKVDILAEDFFSAQIAAIQLEPVRAKASSVETNSVQSQAKPLLSSEKEGESAVSRTIKKRRTLRNHFLSTPLRQEDVADLLGVDQEAISYYLADSAEGCLIRESTQDSNRRQAARDDVQRELAAWIRFSDKEARQYGTGLTPESMEMDGIMRWVAKHFLSKDDVLRPSFREEGVKLAENYAKEGAGWLVIRCIEDSPAGYIQAGRLLESVWLRAAEKSIAFQPMMQLLEENKDEQQLSKVFGTKGKVCFVARIGYVESYPAPVSIRRPLAIAKQ